MKQETTENGCKQIMEELLKSGFSFEVSTRDIENAIIRSELGRDERTWKRWIRSLEAFEFMIPTRKHLYRMNVAKIPHLFALLKNQPQTHLVGLSLSHKISDGGSGCVDATTAGSE